MKYIGPALEIKEIEALVLGDLHIDSDKSQSINNLSPLIGLTNLEETISDIIEKSSAKKIILLGDISNNFGPITYSEKKGIIDFLEWLNSKLQVILIKGNHDNFIAKYLPKNMLFLDEYEESGYYFCHGDILKHNSNSHTIIIGHEHPAIVISNGIRSEKYKCIIETEIFGKKLVVLPSPNQYNIGTNILREKTLSPFLNREVLQKSKIVVVQGINNLDFGSIKNFYP